MRITIEIEGAGGDATRITSDAASTSSASASNTAAAGTASAPGGVNAGPAPTRPGASGDASASGTHLPDENGAQNAGTSAGSAPQLN